MPTSVSLTDRTRAAIQLRLGAVPSRDIPTYRRLGRIFDALELDALPLEAQAQLANAVFPWNQAAREFPISDGVRDDLLLWLAPTEQAPLNGFYGRLLMPVYDALAASEKG
jgi:hypothetical protein